MERRAFLNNVKKGAVGVGVTAVAATLASCGGKKEEPVAQSAPAVVKSRKEVTMVSTWPRDFPGLGTGAQRFAERVNQLSDGSMVITYYAAGELVGAFDSFDEVSSGNAQIYHGADYYWKGKHPGWAFFTAVPFGLTYTEINAWIRFAGGQQLWDELGERFGLKGLMCGNTGVQMGGWFNKEINSAKDLKGLKMRIPGLGGDVMAKLGVSPVSLPGGQIYENLISGTIDATEWVGPWNDEIMKFYEAAKYYYFPGMHEPGAMLAIGMNKSWWESLSPAEQLVIETSASMENDVMMSEYIAKNGNALSRLIRDHGVQLRSFSDGIYDAFGSAATEVFDEVVQFDDLAKRIYDSFAAARADMGGWLNISDAAYILQRNRVLNVK